MSSGDKTDIKTTIENVLADVANKKGFKNYETTPNLDVQVGDGFVAHFYAGTIKDTDSGATVNVAIKRASPMEWDVSPIFKNEVTFYDRVIPALDALQKQAHITEPFNNVPELFCYGLERTQEYLAMENLKTAGYVLFDKKAYLDREHLELIFKIYGKFHALSFVLRKQNSETYRKIHEGYTDVAHAIADALAKQIEASFEAAVDALDPTSQVYEVAKGYPKNIRSTLTKATNYYGKYGCFIHGDCWSNNMMFKYADSGKLEDIKLFDFQLARESTPIHDLCYFFYSGASKTDIDDIEYYLKVYHNTLSEVIRKLGEDPDEVFPYDALLQEWKDNALLGVIMGVYLWQIKLVPKESFQNLLTGIDRPEEESFAILFRLLTETLKSDAYRERTSALLIHAFEYGILTTDKIIVKRSEEAPVLATE